MDSRDIRFTNKKVDESWKEQATREKDVLSPKSKDSSPSPKSSPIPAAETSKEFVNLLSSLGYQAMFHLGEIPGPEGSQGEVNLEAAKEAIDLLLMLRGKTRGNLSVEETKIFDSILPELQLKFSQKA